MKSKWKHLQYLRSIQRSICRVIDRVYIEGHIPVWQLKIWGRNIKDAANFMQKEIEKAKKKKAKKK